MGETKQRPGLEDARWLVGLAGKGIAVHACTVRYALWRCGAVAGWWVGDEEGRVGKDVRSHPVTRAVPSALVSLTSGFGMVPGRPSPLHSPTRRSSSPFYFCCALRFQTLRFTSPASPSNQAKPSTVSTGWLQTLLPFHLPPIPLVVSQQSRLSLLRMGVSS